MGFRIELVSQAHTIKMLNEEAVKKLKGQDSSNEASRRGDDQDDLPTADPMTDDAENIAEAPKEDAPKSAGLSLFFYSPCCLILLSCIGVLFWQNEKPPKPCFTRSKSCPAALSKSTNRD